MMRARSKALYAEAQALMPGGVSSPVRAFGAVGGSPIFIERGEGARVVDADGRTSSPAQPNGYKLERFVFDALPHAARSAVVEARRQEEYSPVKNAEGEDSPATARRALVAQYRAWLEAGGIPLPGDAPWIELDHSVIDGPDDARQSQLRDAAQAGDAIRIGQGAHA